MKQKILSKHNSSLAWQEKARLAIMIYRNSVGKRNLRKDGETIAHLSRIQRRLVGSELEKKALLADSRLTK